MTSIKKKFFSILFITIFVSAIILFQRREQILLAFGNFLVVQDQLQPADVIHVIAGPDRRADYAIYLYKQGLGKYLFFTGYWSEFHQQSHGQRGKERALAQGIPLEAIRFDDSEVKSTYEEVTRLQVFIEKSPVPIKSVIVVSDPYHMRRSEWTYMKVLGKRIEILMAPVPFEQTPYHRKWWTDKESQRYVMDEYKKSMYYLLRYQFSWGWMRDWLASLDTE